MCSSSYTSSNANGDGRPPPAPRQEPGKTNSSSQPLDGAARKKVVAGRNVSPPVNSASETTHKQNINTRSSMDFWENVYKNSARSTVKVGKIMFKTLLRPLVRTMSQVVTATCLQPLTAHHNLKLHDFMTVIIEVDSSRPGWQKGVLVVLRNCKGARFKMDQNGVVEISALGDPKKLLKKLGRSSRVKLLWFQFGQCSENLFMASSGKKRDPPAQESKLPNIGHGNSTRFPFLPNMHAGFAQQPHLVTPYGPY